MTTTAEKNLSLLETFSKELRTIALTEEFRETQKKSPVENQFTNFVKRKLPPSLLQMAKPLNSNTGFLEKTAPKDLKTIKEFWTAFCDNSDNHDLGEREFWKAVRNEVPGTYFEDPVIGKKLLEMDQKAFGKHPQYEKPLFAPEVK